MAATALTVTEISSLYPSAGDEFAFEASDPTNTNTFTLTGREIILALNSSADTEYDITISSTPDAQGRTGDLVETIPFGEYRVYMLATRGWRNSSRKVVIDTENADILLAVIRLPS